MIGVTQPSPTSGAPTRDLLAAAIRGDSQAVDEFCRWSWPLARRVAFLITHDQGSADDVAQESVMAAVVALAGFDLARPPRPWLERIAANKSLDWLRRQHVREEAALRQIDESRMLELADSTADLITAAVSDDVLAALGALGAETRAAIVLRFLLDFESAEIAALLDIPASTIRTRIHRGLSVLRGALSDREREIRQ